MSGYAREGYIDILRLVSENKESIITASLVLYVFAYALVGVLGVGFQAQPAAAQYQGDSCQSGADCKGNLICNENGKCVNQPTLTLPADCKDKFIGDTCPSGEVCNENQNCVCASNSACGPGQVCRNQECVDAAGASCSNALIGGRGCGSGYKCVGGTCERKGPSDKGCVSRDDCQVGYKCPIGIPGMTTCTELNCGPIPYNAKTVCSGNVKRGVVEVGSSGEYYMTSGRWTFADGETIYMSSTSYGGFQAAARSCRSYSAGESLNSRKLKECKTSGTFCDSDKRTDCRDYDGDGSPDDLVTANDLHRNAGCSGGSCVSTEVDKFDTENCVVDVSYDDPTCKPQSCDEDGDGYDKDNARCGGLDCNDQNSAINPDTVWYKDADGDGYWSETRQQCERPGPDWERR